MALPTASTNYRGLAALLASEYGVDPGVFVRQINQESGFNPTAVSPAGAQGIAQFMPGTAAALGINPWNPVEALRGAASYMSRLLHQYNGNYTLALAAYNAGSGAVSEYGPDLSKWPSPTYDQTRQYVNDILGSGSGNVLPDTQTSEQNATSDSSSSDTITIHTPAGDITLANPLAGFGLAVHRAAVRGGAIVGGGVLVVIGLMLITKTNPVDLASGGKL